MTSLPLRPSQPAVHAFGAGVLLLVTAVSALLWQADQPWRNNRAHLLNYVYDPLEP